MKCSKCGGTDISIRYNRGGDSCSECHSFSSCDHHRKDEHLDCYCRDCSYVWEGDCMKSDSSREEFLKKLEELKKWVEETWGDDLTPLDLMEKVFGPSVRR